MRLQSYLLYTSIKIINKMKSGQIPCTRLELDLGITLNGGQSFRWKQLNDTFYRGVFSGSVWTLCQTDDHICYTVNASLDMNQDFKSILSDYFQLEVSLQKNIEYWIKADPNFANLYNSTTGVRILNQDVIENLFSFICSSNNNINRISGMIEKLCQFFGTKIGEIDSKEYYDFPTIESLSDINVQNILRKEGFGYRAEYISCSAMLLNNLGGREWLMNLHKRNNTTYKSAKEKLMTLKGIGPKVADCICLMSLGHLNAIPVDTHIFQIACANYTPHLKLKKSVTPKTNEEISLHLQNLWGPLAGWAQAIAFCAKINKKIPSIKNRPLKTKMIKNTKENSKKKN